MVLKKINILKVKNIIINEVIEKIKYDNHLLRILIKKNINNDITNNENIDIENIDIENIDIEKNVYEKITSYQNNSITKKIRIYKENDKKIKINFEINNNGEIYIINIILTKIFHNNQKIEQQYTISLDLEYNSICNFRCSNSLCILIYAFCFQRCISSCCLSNNYQNEINYYLDNL